jgi:hypothetical protein
LGTVCTIKDDESWFRSIPDSCDANTLVYVLVAGITLFHHAAELAVSMPNVMARDVLNNPFEAQIDLAQEVFFTEAYRNLFPVIYLKSTAYK